MLHTPAACCFAATPAAHSCCVLFCSHSCCTLLLRVVLQPLLLHTPAACCFAATRAAHSCCVLFCSHKCCTLLLRVVLSPQVLHTPAACCFVATSSAHSCCVLFCSHWCDRAVVAPRNRHGFQYKCMCSCVHTCRVGQSRLFAPYVPVYLVISLPKIPHTYGSGQPCVHLPTRVGLTKAVYIYMRRTCPHIW